MRMIKDVIRMIAAGIRDEAELKCQDGRYFFLWFLLPLWTHSELYNQSGGEN